MRKLITLGQAVDLVKDDMTLGVGGFGAYGAPESLLKALADRYDSTGTPRELTVTCTVSPGDNTRQAVGLNRIAKPGLLGTMIAGHFANPPLIAEMIAKDQVAGYAIPLGVMVHLYNAIAEHAPAVLTSIGLNTYADPRFEGCKVNGRARSQSRVAVERVNMDGKPYLAYKTFPIDVCFLRGTFADEAGNISVEEEALGDFSFNLAAATHNNGGIVVVEVRQIVTEGTLHPKQVRIHAPIVDYVVLSEPGQHSQGYAAYRRPELCGDIRVPVTALEPMAMSNRKIIARRSAMELKPNCLINLGIGIPSGIGSVANEEGISATMSLESGPQGGVPVEGLGFAGSVNPEAIYNLSDVFTLYDGGVLDMTFLGAAEIDEQGNVNVSRFGSRCTGPGGFINISQSTRKVHFIGTFTAGGLQEEVRDGKLVILKEGREKKLCKQVQQITFSGKQALENGQQVMYITERAVFRLTDKGLLLTEIALGVDLQRDILDQMDFVPQISPELKMMDGRIFREEKMGLSEK